MTTAADEPPSAAGRRATLLVPDLGLPAETPVAVSLWLVPEGAAVIEGDRVVELVVAGATLDLEAPLTGRLVTQLVEEDEPVAPGAAVAEFAVDPSAP